MTWSDSRRSGSPWSDSPWSDWAELVRLPAALSVPGDSLSGAAAAGWPFGPRTAALPVASACFYWAGMALNDYADRELDAVERPERPLPSGRVQPRTALALAAGLTVAGTGVAAWAGGRRGLAVALPLVATVWSYDLLLKPTWAGPVAMGAARGLDVLLGAGSERWRAAAPSAAAVSAHAFATTVLSRGEVHGAGRVPPALSVATSVTAALSAASRPRVVPAAVALAGWYAANVVPAQARAVSDPSAGPVRAAVGASVLGTTGLQAALLARAGSAPLGVLVAGALPLARRLSRRNSPT